MSVTAYQDSLNKYMDSIKLFPITGKVSMYFTISKEGEIIDVLVTKGTLKKIAEVISGLKSFSSAWHGAKQNNHSVCAYKEIEMEFYGDRFAFTKL